MIRLAAPGDAGQLFALNEAFNGPGTATPDSIRASLAENGREIVVIAEAEGGTLAGFVCAQVKRSFCYGEASAEITEVYVAPEYRRRGYGRAMLEFAERCCRERFGVDGITLLTGKDNAAAQELYAAAGYRRTGEVHYEKDCFAADRVAH